MPRLWQRQPGESPADFTAFVIYLRLKGRRSLRAVATQSGRPLGSLRRLSARFQWRSRVAAFETRLADASQNALDLLVQATATRSTADFERLRAAEFQLAQRVLHQSQRWLRVASDPRRRDISLQQVCQLIDLATKLGRLAAGMPTGDEPRRRTHVEDAPGYWTGPSAEEALARIYGDSDPAPSTVPGPGQALASSPPAGVSGGDGVTLDSPVAPRPAESRTPVAGSEPARLEPVTCDPPPPATAGQPPVASPQNRRRDAWAACSRHQRRAASLSPV